MRVLHIIDTLGLGGAQTVVKGIFEEQKNNEDIFLYSLRNKITNITIHHSNVKISSSQTKYSLKPLKELKKIIFNEKIEILHCHLFRSQLYAYLLKRLYFPNIRLIFHEHGKIYRNKPYYSQFISHSNNYVEKYIAVSIATKKKLINKTNIPKSKITVIYNFVDLKIFNRKNINYDIQKEKEKANINKKDFTIGFASRIVERKGWREFIEAAKFLVKENNNFKFLIAGDGSQKKKMCQLIQKYDLKNNVVYLGYMKDMKKFYSFLDIFVIPSHWEPMGLTEIECQAMAIPIIAANVDGLNEIVCDRENCLMFKPKNIEDLTNKIMQLHKNMKLRKKLISGGLRNVKKYDLKKYVHNLNKIYEK